MIDITEVSSIAAAAETVSSAVGKGGLFGLVNNAGIVRPGPLEFQPLDDFRLQLEVNYALETGWLAWPMTLSMKALACPSKSGFRFGGGILSPNERTFGFPAHM